MTAADATPKNGGSPGDLLDAFARQAAAWSPPPAADAAVAAAVLLGWRAGEALTWAQAAAKADAAAIDRLGDRDAGLASSARWAVLAGQIEAARGRLRVPDAAAPTLDGGPPPGTTAEAVGGLRDGLLEALYVADESRGKAFRAGYELQQLCAGAWNAAGGSARDAAAHVQVLLVALATKLPANAAHSVRNSIILWEERLAGNAPDARLLETLARQGDLWRGMLAGEVAATDLLRVSDYVGTAEEVVGRIHELALRTVRGRLRALAIAVGALLVIGIVVLAVFSHSAGGVTAGAGSLIAAFGLTWKGIGTFFGHAAGKAEQALWDSEIDWTIAYRATLGESQPGGPRDTRVEHRQAHLATWKAWKEKWPDLDVVDSRPLNRADRG